MKIQNITLAAVILFGFVTSCKMPQDAKILLVGDSWATLMCYNATFDSILSQNNLSSKYRTECLTTTQIGTRADQWSQPSYLKKISTIMKLDTKLEYVVLSLGGNDYFHYWNRNLSADQQAALFSNVANNITMVVKYIQSLSPGIKVIINSYDYVNFEVLNSSPLYSAYQQTYADMGSPTPLELNTGLQKLISAMKQAASNTNAMMVDNSGLMQYYYGQLDYNILPKTVSLPGGDIHVPGPKEAMLEIQTLNYMDPFHLDKAAFAIIGNHIYEQINLK